MSVHIFAFTKSTNSPRSYWHSRCYLAKKRRGFSLLRTTNSSLVLSLSLPRMHLLWWFSRVWVNSDWKWKAVQWHSFASFCVLNAWTQTSGVLNRNSRCGQQASLKVALSRSSQSRTKAHRKCTVYSNMTLVSHHYEFWLWELRVLNLHAVGPSVFPGGLCGHVCVSLSAVCQTEELKRHLCFTDTSHHHWSQSIRQDC